MYSIKHNNKYILEVKKSTFIGLLYKVESINDIDKYLKEVKEEYKDAKHYCYAYKLIDKEKYFDDGEPGGTAGLPIMEVLNKKELINVLCIVVRYFGGIKLGAGGLLRAYTKASSNTIENDNMIELINGYLIEINTSYDKQKELDNTIKGYSYTKEYETTIKYLIKGDNSLLDKLNSIDIKYLIKEEIYIKKDSN